VPVRRRNDSDDVIPSDEEGIRRTFSAPRELVFEVWTKAEHFTRWFGPHGAEVVACELDARPGGVIRFGHRSGDGVTLYVKGTFTDVVVNERLVFALGVVDEQGRPIPHPMFADWPLEVLIEMTVLLDDVGDGTTVTVEHRILPPSAASHPATKLWFPLARQGSTQVLERLGEHLSHVASRKEGTT